jgi:hypothetical protein
MISFSALYFSEFFVTLGAIPARGRADWVVGRQPRAPKCTKVQVQLRRSRHASSANAMGATADDARYAVAARTA